MGLYPRYATHYPHRALLIPNPPHPNLNRITPLCFMSYLFTMGKG